MSDTSPLPLSMEQLEARAEWLRELRDKATPGELSLVFGGILSNAMLSAKELNGSVILETNRPWARAADAANCRYIEAFWNDGLALIEELLSALKTGEEGGGNV